tara:strand:- start:8 stop:190 length:183 start_codon:yes stop_codon:yes gene_type:complete
MSDTILAFAILGNIFNIAYNIPFVYKVIKYTVTLTSSLLVTYVKFTPKNNNELNLDSSEA